MPENLLYHGDNLDILRRHITDESVDLTYLDPPVNSNQTLHVQHDTCPANSSWPSLTQTNRPIPSEDWAIGQSLSLLRCRRN